jgi:hypothetical protein
MKESIRSELQATRADYHALLGSLSEQGWYGRSRNPAWTNGQLLFHVTLAFLLVLPLFRIMRLFGRLPRRCSKIFASLLNLSTPLFNRVNAIGPRVGARIYQRDALGRKYDRVHAAILKRLYSIRDEEWARGMYYPTRWEPSFAEYMRFEDLFHYPTVHFKHHRSQFFSEESS